MGAFSSPFIVPVAGVVWLTIMGISSMVGKAHSQRLKADQRMAMLQRGMSAEQIAQILQPEESGECGQGARTKDPLRSLANARRAGVVLVSIGIGLSIFGFVLSTILQVREVLAVSATGLIPLAIGVGFFVDYSLQKRELARFGLEVAADLPPQDRPR
jgi:hypothetical protein